MNGTYIFEIVNRTIVPSATEELAVVNDNDSRCITFKIPSVIDGIDITDKILTVRYVNSLNRYDQFFCNTREVITEGNEQFVLFDWVLSADVTASKGTVTYDVSIYDTNDISNVSQYILHTKPATFEVDEGLLDVGAPIEDENALQIAIDRFNTIAAKYYNDMLAVSKEAQAAADAAAKSAASLKVDDTLTILGYAADAKTVGDKLTGKAESSEVTSVRSDLQNEIDRATNTESYIKGSKVDKPSASDDGKIPRAKSGDVEWVEAITTVQDGSITISKLSDEFYNHAFQSANSSFNIIANTTIYNTKVLISAAIKQGNKYVIKVSDNNNSLSKMHLYECNSDKKTDAGIISSGFEYEKTASQDISYFAIWTSTAPSSDATGVIELKYDYTAISIVDKVEMLENNFNNLGANVYNTDAGRSINAALSMRKSITLTPGKTYTIKTPIVLTAGNILNANGAILLNETDEYCIYMNNKVGNSCLLTGATIINNYGIKVMGPNITVENCFFNNVQNCVFVPTGYNSYEFSCLNCHAHANTLINIGFVIESTDAFLQNITMLNYKYPLTIKGGNTKIDNFHPWIGVGIDNSNSTFITCAPVENTSASAYISNSTFDGYNTIFSLQNGYTFVQSINCNATYSPYTWNDATKVPEMIENTGDTVCTVKLIGCRFVNSTGNKKINVNLHNIMLFTNNTTLNDINNYSQAFTITSSANFNTDGSSITRNNNEKGVSVRITATTTQTITLAKFSVCTVNIAVLPSQLSCLVIDGDDVKTLPAYIKDYAVYICPNSDTTLHESCRISITGDAYIE